MMSRLQPIRVFHIVFILLIITGGLFSPRTAVAQTYDWLAADGPEGGYVETLAQAPGGDIYAGLWNSGGVFRSTDQGLTWQATGLPYEQVHSIVVNNAGAVFAGASTGDVFRSTDNGATWPVVWPGIVAHFGALAYDPVLDIVYAARYESCSRSIDGGVTWEVIDVDFPAAQVRALAAVPNLGSLYAGTSADKVYSSGDGGVTWDLFGDGMSANGVYDFLVVPEGYVYAATYGGGICRAQWDDSAWVEYFSGLGDTFCLAIGRDAAGSLWAGTFSAGPYLSHNGGLNWAAAHTGMGLVKVKDFLFPGAGNYLAACEGGGVFRTENSGATWAPSNSGMSRTVVNSLCKTGTGAVFAATSGGGVHRSLDEGVTWEPVNDGIVDPIVLDVVSHPDGELFCGTWYGHIYISSNGGDTWSRTASEPSFPRVACFAVKASTGDLFAGAFFDGGVWRSADKGVSWAPANGGLADQGLAQLIVEDDGDLLGVTADSGIFRTENDGASWTPINNGLPLLYVSQALSLPGGVLFAAISGHGLQRSLDDGGSWEQVDSSLNEVYITSVAANSSGYVFAGANYDGKVYQSSDGGDSWVEISGYFPRALTTTMTFTDGGRLLVGTQGFGVIMTVQTTPVFLRDFTAVRSDAGTVSVRWSLPSGANSVSVEVFRSVAGSTREQLTFGREMDGPEFEFVDAEAPSDPCEYWLRLTDTAGLTSWFGPVSVEKASPVISRLAIETVWPNPALEATTIRYAVPRGETARLEIYDLQGRLVRRLRQDAGGTETLEAVWDARDERGSRVASGTYFLRLSTQASVVTGKMVVLGRRR